MDYVFHFTGKGNQSYVMKDTEGNAVYEAACQKVTLFRDTPFLFRNLAAGTQTEKMIGHSKSFALGNGHDFNVTITSSFKVDGVQIWDMLRDMGYGFRFRLNGVAPHYDVTKKGENIGSCELAGTGAMNPKYKDSMAGKIPTNGIFRVECQPEEVPGMFLVCFALTKTDTATDNLKL